MTISVANTPLSWGIQSAEDTRHPYPVVLDQIHETGYTGVEAAPWGYLPTTPDVLRGELEARALVLAGASLRVNLTNPQAHEIGATRAAEIGRVLAALGARILVLIDLTERDSKPAHQAGRVRSPRLSDDEWQIVTTGVNRIAQTLYDEVGLKVAFHPHVGTHIEISEETHILMDRVNPDYVGLCLDTGHWRYAGGDPSAAVGEYGERIWHVHLSDTDPDIRQFAIDEQLTSFEATQAGVFCPLGEGDVDFPTILSGLRRMQYDGWLVVEQDNLLDEPNADRSNARINREYLSKFSL